ncbi:hypothetical protein [Candidatus Symbiothrix dinenymphae]|uniref:hypothetical protein n=1 Tax=Candidatus Symbiothrix dinenymphae TaxID=467085 RepID=UPI000702A724|nr:hypothetical protein [Candidatus Symbiothrix dinenymphae]
MTFDKITDDGRLWAVRYGDESDNELYKLFEQWNDVVWLRAFFKQNWSDLLAYYNILDVKTAIIDTIEDSNRLENILLSISLVADLDSVFRPLNNYTKESFLEKENPRLSQRQKHASWLRLYAIKLSQGIFIITGGAIKLTATMQERDHTAKELIKIEQTRRFLIENGIVDETGFVDYLKEL